VAELTAEVATWLRSEPGLASVAAATADLDDGLDALTVGTRLRTRGLDPGRAAAVLGAAEGRRRARERWPDAERLLFTPTGLEQASDPAVASWRAGRLTGGPRPSAVGGAGEPAGADGRPVWDLCAGLGSDAMALAAAGAEVTAVDLDPGRLRLLEHNASRRGLRIRTLEADALTAPVPADALVHADPSRRDVGRRVRRLADHHPAVGRLLAARSDAPGIGVVLSPAVDLDDPDLPAAAELEFIAIGNELKEAVAWVGEPRAAGAVASATLLPDGHHRSRGERRAPLPVRDVGGHLVEVAAAAVRARLHDEIGAEVGAGRVARRRALLTTDDPPPASPWYRVRPVLEVLPARPKVVRSWLRGVAGVPVEIVVHGLPADPGEWWRRLGRPRRGPQGLRIELVRTDDGAQAVVTDVRPPPPGTLPS
jgi:hypothetical protein